MSPVVLNIVHGMEAMKEFLESSTIHGLVYISTTRRFVRLLWLCVVSLGFLCAGILIYQSFASWEESPISTTIETLPIEKVKFPRISVCPPKNTFTSLNYDLMKVENSMFDEDQRLKFLNYVTEPIFDAFFKDKYSKVARLC